MKQQAVSLFLTLLSVILNLSIYFEDYIDKALTRKGRGDWNDDSLKHPPSIHS
jgi:hypothetical protein